MLPAASFARPSPPAGFLARLDPATKLAGAVLGVTTCLAAPAWSLPLAAGALLAALLGSGSRPRDLVLAWRPWLPLALLVLAVHALTTVEAAPLGRFSWGGVLQGLVALVRVGSTVGCLVLYRRAATLGDTTTGLAWWLGPLRRRGLDTDRLGLLLAVALGAVPGVLADGKRVEAVVRLRRGGAERGAGGRTRGRGPRRWAARQLDRARVVVPLLEGMVRRAEGLTLAVRERLPRAASPSRPSAGALLVLVAWTAGLVLIIL